MTSLVRGRPPWLVPLALALALRLWALGDLPASLTDDEARLGYHAWSLARTLTGPATPGTEMERPGEVVLSLPYPAQPLETIATAFSVGTLGPTPFAVRLPFAVAGALSVIPATIVAHVVHGSRVAEVAAGLLLATSPWHLAFSRVARDGTWLVLGLLTMVAGMLAGGVGHNRPRHRTQFAWVIAGAAIATLGDPIGAVAASSTAVAIGLWLVPASSLTGAGGKPPRRFPGGRGATAALIAVVLLTVAATVGTFGVGPGELRIGPDRQTIASAETSSVRRLAADPSGIAGVLQAPWAVLARAGLDAYFSHFDLTYLFTRGGADPRDHATGFGQLSLVDLPLVTGGALLAMRAAWSRRDGPMMTRGWGIVVAWLAVAPLPAALAVSRHDAGRSVGMVPALVLLEAGAVAAVWPRLVGQRVTFEAGLALAVSTMSWVVATAVHDPAEAGRAFGSGAFAGYEWARMEIAVGRATQVVVVGDPSQATGVAHLALRLDPAGAGLQHVFTTRPEIDWARERSADGAPMRLFALHGAARIPDGFTEAHVARTGDGRPAVTFVRTRPG